MDEFLSLTIDDIAFGGKGVGRADGKVVFVPFTIPGEQVDVQVVTQKKKFAEARLVSIQKSSPTRVAPRCPYFGRCGGCAYQHLNYSAQLEMKARQVEQTLRRVGRLEHVPMKPILGSPQNYNYRNRIRVHVSDGKIGFYAVESHALVDVDCCPIASPAVNDRLSDLRQRPVTDGDYTLAAQGSGEFFAQVNDGVAQQLIEVVKGLVRPDQSTLIDAYCGAGFFAKQLAPQFEKVLGIEENSFAIAHALRSAKPHESYIAGDVAAHLPGVLATHDLQKTTLMLDPPATGVAPRVLDSILAAPPREIVYVSCNPATLARDLAILCPAFTLQSVTPLDMFPQTAEIEVVAHLLRQC